MFAGDPVTPVLDYRVVGLAFVSVGLFIASTILTYLVNDKLATLKKTQETMQVESQSSAVRQDKILETVEEHKKEAHEQWTRLNEVNGLQKENSFLLRDMKDTLDTLGEQHTILATAQVKSNENQQKLTDALVRILTEHVRE